MASAQGRASGNGAGRPGQDMLTPMEETLSLLLLIGYSRDVDLT